MADAGWYPDAQDPNAEHYFDGQNWTGQRRPTGSQQAPPAQQPQSQSPQFSQADPWQPQPDASGETVRRSDLPGAGAAQFGQPQGYQQPDQQAGYQQPGYQQPGYQQPGYQPQGYQQPDQQAGHQPTQAFAQQQGYQQAPDHSGWQPQAGAPLWDQPAQGKKRGRKPLIIAGVAVVVVAAGLVTWLVLPGDDAPSITFGGKEISAASDTLTTAEKTVAGAVADRHGAKTDDTRCYFARPKKAASGDKKSDVQDALRCGPVLFVDGEKGADYLKVPITATDSGSKATLEAKTDVSTLEPAAVGDDVDLVRPDGKTPPDGDGGLAVPQPPPATKDLLVATALGSTAAPAAVTGAVMVGKTTKVTVTKAGAIQRYGTGDDARSAPAGQRLIAFQVTYGSGDVSSGGGPAQLSVGTATARDLPESSDPGAWVVAAVPTSGQAQLVLNDGGVKQTLSLPDGKPATGNVAVLRRVNRVGYIGKTISVPIKIKKGSASGKTTFKTTATTTALNFWAPGNTAIHATSPQNAILSIKLTYVFAKETLAYPPNMLTLKLPNGTIVHAKDLQPGEKLYNVFEVPANFTSGTLTINGSMKAAGYTLSVTKPSTFSVRISA